MSLLSALDPCNQGFWAVPFAHILRSCAGAASRGVIGAYHKGSTPGACALCRVTYGTAYLDRLHKRGACLEKLRLGVHTLLKGSAASASRSRKWLTDEWERKTKSVTA